MAAIRSRGLLPVGSMQWINDENTQVDRHCEQESEDFGFSARNELEWLNEHMADIFAKDQMNVTEFFKTPGKLRGKTPRTVRKRDPLQAREPLSDIFSTNAESHGHPVFSLQNKSPERQVPSFKVAQDASEAPTSRLQKKTNTDSGYHGLPEDDMDIDRAQLSADTLGTVKSAPRLPSRLHVHSLEQNEDRSTTERSFHSAREEITKTNVLESIQQASKPPGVAVLDDVPSTDAHPDVMAIDPEIIGGDLVEESVADESRSPSQGSSPAKPLVRKSSLTFAALPAREPLTTKKSLGNRNSRTSNLDQSNFLGRFTGGMSLGAIKSSDPTGEEREETPSGKGFGDKPALVREESDTDSKMRRLHNKSTTQLLHEKIHLLGKSQAARPTKSIPAVTSITQPTYPQLPDAQAQLQKTARPAAQQSNAEDDDDWIQPPNAVSKPGARPPLSKSISTDVMEDIRGKQTISDKDLSIQRLEGSASRVQSPFPYAGKVEDLRTASDSRAASPGIYSAYDGVKTFDDADNMEASRGRHFGTSTTPFGSPLSKRYVDGPLSASKSKLQSVMKTAKSLFSSSAGVSAQAKMNLLSPPDEHGPKNPNWEVLEGNGSEEAQSQPLPDLVEDTARPNTRSSTEKAERTRQGAADRLAVGHKHTERNDSEKSKVSAKLEVSEPANPNNYLQPPARPTRTSPRRPQNQDPPQIPERTTSKKRPHQEAPEIPRHVEQSSQSTARQAVQDQRQSSQTQRTKDPRRPAKPAKDAGPKPKPQPLEIRVGMPSTKRMPLTNAAISTGLQESFKSSVNGTTKTPKSLIAAERKKEQDEKEAQRKRDQKAEIDRRRAAQQEESRRQEQLHRQDVEKQREQERSAAAEDPKKIAQKRAIEERRRELQKKDQHQQRSATNQPTSTTRPELAGGRPPSRQQNVQDNINGSINNHHAPNPSKAPIKRAFDPDNGDAPARPKAPNGPSYQQHEAKRRRTEDEEEEFPMRPTHAPPIRQSGIIKDKLKQTIFANGYGQAPPPAPHHHTGPSLLKSTTQHQAYQHAHPQHILRPANHPDIKQFANNRIPFADAPNPPAHLPQQQQQQPQPPTHKTPHQSKFPPPPHNPSPHYQNGENIQLDDIPTDSEDEQSDSSPASNAGKPKPANLPEWAQSPNLRNLLMHQEEGIDPDAVFGPVQSPHMEEMFKERHHRFRSRTSSANWGGQDRLTDEEIRKDVEARQRLRKDGGWSFGLAP